jgi:hypothetical protein
MKYREYFSHSSRQYLDSIDPGLYQEITGVVTAFPKRVTQKEINNDLFWVLTGKGWSYDTWSGISDTPPPEFSMTDLNREIVAERNNRSLCLTATTLNTTWHADFAKMFNGKLVQIEAQFGKVESMFKDFCGFQLGYYENRLALGIEIVLCEPTRYFAHRLESIGGMAYFDIAQKTLPAIGFDVPIWLVGISE